MVMSDEQKNEFCILLFPNACVMKTDSYFRHDIINSDLCPQDDTHQKQCGVVLTAPAETGN
jgi:hypothetical protein